MPDPADDDNPNPDPKADPPKPDPPRSDSAVSADAERRRANRLESELRKANAALKEVNDAKLTEAEKLTQDRAAFDAEREAWEKDRETARVQSAVESAARKKNFLDPEDAHRFLDLADVESDKDGKPKNVDKLLDDLLAKRPYLAGAAGGTSNPGVRGKGATPSGDMNTFIRRGAGRD